MAFTSFTFLLLFLPVVLLLHAVVPSRFRNLVLMLAGLLFYAWGEPRAVWILLASVLANYGLGLLLGRTAAKPAGVNRTFRRCVIISSLVLNLGVWGLYKWLAPTVGLGLLLPLGMSFYTLQALSYSLDIYRGRVTVQKNPITFGTYLTLFPKLLAGPLVRYEELESELAHRTVTIDQTAAGISLFLNGLGKKVLLADSVAPLWIAVSTISPGSLPAATAWLGVVAFALQVYFDFSGYCDMAAGLAKMLGFTFPDNFDVPFLARSVRDFIRRWNRSLGGWLREYVYLPLGGGRGAPTVAARNMLAVCLLAGLWYGLTGSYLLMGLYLGALVLLERFVWGSLLAKLPRLFQWVYTVAVLTVAWSLFAFPSVGQAFGYVSSLFGGSGVAANNQTLYLLSTNWAALLFCIVCAMDIPRRIGRYFSRKFPHVGPVVGMALRLCVFVVCFCCLAAVGSREFFYFQF